MMKKSFTAILLNLVVLLFSASASAWVINQTYDTQSIGERCSNWWAAENSIVTNKKSASGNNSCRVRIETDTPTYDPGTGYGTWGGGISYPSKLYKGDEVWVRIRTFMPLDFDYTASGKLKFLRHRTQNPSGYGGYNDWLMNHWPRSDYDASYLKPFVFSYEGAPISLDKSPFGSDPEDTIVLGVWETYEWYIKFDNVTQDDGGQARSRMWKNGRLIGDFTWSKTLSTSDTYADALLIFTYWNGGTPKDQEMYIDDLVMTNEIPSGRDEFENPFIGMGGFVPDPEQQLAKPSPPVIH